MSVTTHRFARTALDDAARREVERARILLHDLLDDIGPRLVAAAGDADVEIKPDGTPVTPYDRETDERIVAAVTRAFPSHGTISEEASGIGPDTSWTWVLDPIDGTSNFIAGVPYWCVAVALCLDGDPVLGVVDVPAMSMRMEAVAGEGARDGVRRLHVGRSVDLRDPRSSNVPAMYSGGAARRLLARGVQLNARLMGATAIDLAMVARGASPLAVTMAPHVWDVAAAGLLITEAGGSVVSFGGDPLLPLVPGRTYGTAVTAVAGASDDASAQLAAELAELTGRPDEEPAEDRVH
jgi:myo-inositol-1(or 4)-monophosphatase